jgi:hypothetical protein
VMYVHVVPCHASCLGWSCQRYINATLAALEAAGASGGGRLFDMNRLFFTGCSMGSAYTVWVAQCVHQQMPAAVTAFASQSTGLKVKGVRVTTHCLTVSNVYLADHGYDHE